uniref:Transcription factor domain-containing protein n=1 Tax=Bionectria ochroleuca TaxID=29856 RepID=A0A8H7K5F1_BIOOC
MPLDPSHPDYWTQALQFTETIHRDVYPTVDPTQPSLQRIAQGKVVVVTGAGSGFGEGACKQWAKAGTAAVVLAARSQTNIDRVAQLLNASTETLAISTDVASESQVNNLFEEATKKFGRVDVVIHAAGVLGPIAHIGDAPTDEWWKAFEINVKGAFLVAKAFARVSEGREATFIYTGSAASYFASPGQSSYTAAKAAGNMIMDQLHTEYKNLRVFNVHPGMAKSSVLRSELEIYANDTPDLFGGLTLYLAGKQADFLRGRFVAANWDVGDLEKHQEEIKAQELLKGQAFRGEMGPGGKAAENEYRSAASHVGSTSSDVIAAFRVAPAFAIGEKHSVVRTPPPHNAEERPFGPWIIGQLKTAALRQEQPLSIMVSKAPKLLRRGCMIGMLDMQDYRPSASFARLLGLNEDLVEAPPPSLPQILAEANRERHLSSWWSFLDVHHRKRVYRQQLSATLPSRSQCDLLANYYLEHVNWIFQTIHVPSFRRDYAIFWDTGIDQADLIWLSLLFTVISASALYVPLESIEVVGCPKDSIRHLAHIWHLSSRRALRAGDFEARPCLTQLQTFSVTQLYWYATNDIETLNSHLGQAVRNAQAIGLDKDRTPSTCLQNEMRHRLWWDLVDADMFQTICLDREPLVRLKDPGVPLPLNCDDHDMTVSSIHPKPLDVPTVMSMNIYRAQVFRILNRHWCATHGDCLQSIEGIRRLDSEIVELVTQLPWYFQLDEDGNPPRLSEALREILTWQHHILRTCVSTQRIRMYRPFLANRVENAWENVVKAAEDALAVYRTLRLDGTTTSRQKFSTQAYQVFSVAVTVAALLLVEGSLPIPDAYNLIKDMAMDLRMLENQGCLVPVATHGHQVLLKMLTFFDRRWADPVSPEDAKRLVPDISTILGGRAPQGHTWIVCLHKRSRERQRGQSQWQGSR